MPDQSNNTFRILLDQIFDYAGMFPPASRSFEGALGESSSFTTTLKRAWMVSSDIVLDTEHAHKLLGYNLGVYPFGHPLRVCLLATEDPESVITVARQLSHKEPSVRVTSLEMKVSPQAVTEMVNAYSQFISQTGALLALEPNLSGDDWESVLKQTVDSLNSTPLRPALKCRLTGPTGIGAERFASAILATTAAGLPLKVTGGLHHPIVERERFDFPMGFLNVVSAVMLSRGLGSRLSHADLVQLLTNQEASAFSFGDTLRFKKLSLTAAELRHCKGSEPFTIGSCSLHEPDQDLDRLFAREE